MPITCNWYEDVTVSKIYIIVYPKMLKGYGIQWSMVKKGKVE